MRYFSGIVKCSQCNKNLNFKNNNGLHEYICQTRKNKGRDYCDAQIMQERELLDCLKKHCEIHNKKFDPSKTKLFVKEVRATKFGFVMYFKDGNKIEANESAIYYT